MMLDPLLDAFCKAHFWYAYYERNHKLEDKFP
jgi:hypothetical protein